MWMNSLKTPLKQLKANDRVNKKARHMTHVYKETL